MKDFIIVGGNLAGIAFAETAIQNGKSVFVISDQSQNSSLAAAGIYNPVVLKRMKPTQDAYEQLMYMKPFYTALEKKLNIKFDYPIPLYRKFASVEEQNMWFEAIDNPKLTPFLHPEIQHKKFYGIDSPFGYGKVLHTGYLDTYALIAGYRNFLISQGDFLQETFDHSSLIVEDDCVIYKGYKAKHIIYAEGFGMLKNPYFENLPLNGTKGELLLIKAPELNLSVCIKSSLFVLPVGNDLYKVGATYEWEDKTSTPTEAAKLELVEKLNEIIGCPYEIIEQYAGVRPTTKDRKPLIGTHPEHKNIHLLNGLGTRGVMLAPYMAKELYESIQNGEPMKREINLNRFIS
ncbi:NAD(P)/FAD-dependent oxidoreductase [Flavobacterium psychrotrophum]|uniref:NAD(P)/FAD-dependent oxidoreductase n=1 Tax=Flavobacterium psychrotrophum TaxID=2294119 RepID=UPI000E31DDE8|nr:FAD-binding oxidoreductase [Flavobacterium psychrotrophum]